MEKIFLIIIITLIIGIGIIYTVVNKNPDKIEGLRLEEEKQILLNNIDKFKYCKIDSDCIQLKADECACPVAVNNSNFVERINTYTTRISDLKGKAIICQNYCPKTLLKCIQNKCDIIKP